MRINGSSKTKCPECSKTFDIHENKSRKIKDSVVPGGWFFYAMNQFENFSQVTCPFCQKTYRSEEARLFVVFKSPYTVVIVCLLFVGAVVGCLVLLKTFLHP